MLTVINKSQALREFCVWDLEWKPRSYELRLCGVYEPKGGYRKYRTILEFLRNELVPSQSGMWFYAHFGGGADLQFLIEEIQSKPEYSFRGTMSGSACVIAHIRAHPPKCVWHFVDSYWLLRAPLKDIAKSIGEEKTGPADDMSDEERKAWYETVDDAILQEYNENDCVVLWKAIHRTQCAMLELGGQLQMTIASSAMQLFRRQYLTQDVETTKGINMVAQEAYFASRVEVYQKEVAYPGLYYDVNSSFPFAMTQELPGPLHSNHRTIPNEAWDNYPFLADVDFSIPDIWLPPIPARLKGKIFFPVGRWRSWLTGIDLKLLLREGGKINKVFACKTFEPFYDLSYYATDLYNKRAATSDPFLREFYKLFLNSLYGKFAEQPSKTTLIINPSAKALESLDRRTQMLMPGVFFKNSEVPIPHAHVPISAYITAIARQTLYDYMSQAEEIHYCDTDGFSTTDEYAITNSLGGLKLEKSFSSATFLVPKLYRWQPSDAALPPVVKAKGFSLGKDKRIASEKFEHLMHGGEVEINRMVRIREAMRDAHRTGSAFRPHDKQFTKGLRQTGFLAGNYEDGALPKRFMYPDGYTRPWSYREILEKKK